MSLVTVIEVSAESAHGYDDAARQAVRRAARTVQTFSAIWLKEFEAVARGGSGGPFRVNARVACVLDQGKAGDHQAEASIRT